MINENVRVDLDLMKLKGAQLASVTVGGKKMNCVIIPTDWNDVFIGKDKETGAPMSAHLNLNAFTVNDNFRKACLERNRDREGYIAPSHQLSINYSKEKREAILKKLEANLRADEKYMATSPSDEDVQKQARYNLTDQTRCGMLVPFSNGVAAQFTGAAPDVQVGGFVAPAAGDPGYVNADDDLPF